MKGDIIDDYYKRPDAGGGGEMKGPLECIHTMDISSIGRGSVPLQPLRRLELRVQELERDIGESALKHIQVQHVAAMKNAKLEEEIAELKCKLSDNTKFVMQFLSASQCEKHQRDALNESPSEFVDKEQDHCSRCEREGIAFLRAKLATRQLGAQMLHHTCPGPCKLCTVLRDTSEEE